MAKTFAETLAVLGVDELKRGPSITQFGVKGMHWGVRRDTRSGSVTVTSPKGSNKATVTGFDPKKVKVNPVTGEVSGTSRRQVKQVRKELETVSKNLRKMDNVSDDYKKAYVARKKDPSELNNDEMRAMLERMRLEDDYGRMMARQVAVTPSSPGKIAAGKKFAGELIKEIARDEVKRVSKVAVRQGINKAAKSKGWDIEPKKDKKNK